MQINQGVQNALLVKGELQNKTQTWSHLCTYSYACTYRVNVSDYPASMTAARVTRARGLKPDRRLFPDTGIVRFLNCASHQVNFYKKSSIRARFGWPKEIRRGFCLCRNGKEQKQHSLCLAVSGVGGCAPSSRERGAPQRLPGELHSVSGFQRRELGTGPVSMCALPDSLCASIGKTCSKVPEKPQRDYFWGYGNAQNISHVIYDNCFFTLHTIFGS